MPVGEYSFINPYMPAEGVAEGVLLVLESVKPQLSVHASLTPCSELTEQSRNWATKCMLCHCRCSAFFGSMAMCGLGCALARSYLVGDLFWHRLLCPSFASMRVVRCTVLHGLSLFGMCPVCAAGRGPSC